MTRLTLRTHPLPVPEFFGAVSATVRATSDAAFRRLIGRIVGFYAERLLNPHWGEQLVFRPDNVLADRHGVPGARPGAGGGGLAPLLRRAGRGARRTSGSWRRRRSWRRRPGGSGTRRCSGRCPAWCSPTTAPGPPRPTCSTRATGGGGAGAARLPVRLAPRLAPAGGRAGGPRRRPVRRHPALERLPAHQQGPRRRPGRGRRGGPGHGDEPGRAGRLRAGHQRRRGAPGLPRRPRPRAGRGHRPRGGGGGRPGHAGGAAPAPRPRRVRRRERLLRGGLAAGLLGAALRRGCWR